MVAPYLPITARTLQSVSIAGVSHSLTGAGVGALHQSFAGYFGPHVSVQDLIQSFERENTNLTIESLSLLPTGPDTFETHAAFSGPQRQFEGTCRYVWRRLPDGSLARLKDASLQITGSQNRLSLQIHGNLMEFCRKSGVVSRFSIEARDVGRYAYRFMHGVQIEEETLRDVEQQLRDHAAILDRPFDEAKFRQLKSPRDLADFIVLPDINPRWMSIVDQIIHRHGYQFTVDQVVDVARRPGLAFLLDRHRYAMNLDIQDETAFSQFSESVFAGRNRDSLQRIRGVLGIPYGHLPEDVRNALIVFRPYIFPRPKKTPPMPDLSNLQQPPSPYNVLGFRSQDGKLMRSLPPDPQGTQLHDYRADEVRRIIDAFESGIEIVSATGLSGSGKTEVLIWNLERALSQRGHRVVSLDAQEMGGRESARELLRRIDQFVQPTVVIFDESVYISGPRCEAFIDFTKEFLKRPGQHVIFVGGGVISPEEQRTRIERQLEELWESYRTAHVSLYPKPINLAQAYRFLGLARIDWADEAAKIGLLTYILERYPPYFIPLIPIRLHEHDAISSMDAAKTLIDSEIAPEFWAGATLMVIEGFSTLRDGE